MKKKSLLDELKQLADTATCPDAHWRNPAERARRYAQEFLSSNLSDYRTRDFETEIDPDSGDLLVYWKISAAISDLFTEARIIATATGGNASEPESVANVKIGMRQNIPMFFRGEGGTHHADGQPMRPEFADNLKEFARRFDDINAKAREAVFEPIREAAASRAKYQRAA